MVIPAGLKESSEYKDLTCPTPQERAFELKKQNSRLSNHADPPNEIGRETLVQSPGPDEFATCDDVAQHIENARHRQQLRGVGLYPDVSEFDTPPENILDFLRSKSIPLSSLMRPCPILVAFGESEDGLFYSVCPGAPWIVFLEPDDCVFWNIRTGELATWAGRAFALGEAAIANPATYAFDGFLQLHENVVDWLKAEREGCVVVNWTAAFDRLRDCERIAVPERLLKKYMKYGRSPSRLPKIFVVENGRTA